MSAPRDPFYAVKDKVIASLTTADTQYKSVINNPHTNTATHNTDITDLQQLIADIQIDVNDLAQTITIVETNRSKFTQISDAELHSRSTFVTQTRGKLNDMNKTLNTVKIDIKKSSTNARSQLTTKPQHTPTAGGRSTGNGDAVYGAREQQVMVERQQDEVLDDMTTALDRLQNLAGDINTELKTQDVMLSELDGEIDEASGTMKRTIKRLDKLLATSDKGRLGCIGIMFLLVVLLFFLVIYA